MIIAAEGGGSSVRYVKILAAGLLAGIATAGWARRSTAPLAVNFGNRGTTKLGKSLAGALAALMAASSLSAAPASLADDARAFGTRPSAEQVAISPSGDKVVMLVAGPGASTAAKVFDLRTGAETTPVSSPGNPEALKWCQFGTDTQLVCKYGGNLYVDGVLMPFSRLVTVGTDGKGLKLLGQEKSFYDNGLRQFDGDILDWLTSGTGAVLMAREYVPEIGKTGTKMIRRTKGLGVDRIDLQSLKSSTVESPDRLTSDYMTDGRGNVRLRIRSEAEGDGTLTGISSFAYRLSGSNDWKPLGQYDSRNDSGILPLAIEADSNSLFFLQKLNGRNALYRMALDGSAATTLVSKNDAVDIDGVKRFGRGQKVIAYTYTEDRTHAVYFDPEFDGLAKSLGRALPASPLITFTGASADGNSLLVYAGSDTNAGTYYFLDRKTREMSDLADVRPLLRGKTLSPVKAVTYKSRDGASIPAYITLPAGSTGKNMPAVVLPHGGPSSRDEWGFDWLAQFLAARGYVVIQPNYRGSAGYGDDFQNGNAFRNWQTAMSDIADSARYLVDSGIASKDRLAIFGWSYGGYAALQTAEIEPTLFKAVVAIAPVTDLELIKRRAEDFTNSELVKEEIGSGDNVRAGSPLRNATAIKAPVLLVHGDLDVNVGIEHSQKMASALTAAGKQVEFLSYKGLDHQLDDSKVRTEMLTKAGELLDRTIGH
jgi:dipeptidyl aminopeptidase/acylaminoacyl peptidase